MNTNNLASLLAIENLKTIGVYFDVDCHGEPAKIYTYKTTDDSIKEGDKVIVPINDGYKIVTIARVDIVANFILDHIEYKWIIQKVDTKTYYALIEKEKAIAIKLLQLEQAAVVNTAKNMLSDKLNITTTELEKQIRD